MALQEQVEDFAILVSDIKDHYAGAAPETITTALFRTTMTLRHLHSIIKTKILQEPNITVRVLRRAWARNRTNVFRLQDALKENRLSLLAAMSANSLYSSSRSAMTALYQDQRLVDIQRTVLSTHRAVVSQSTAVDHLLQSIPGGSRSQYVEQAKFRDPASPLELSGNFFPETYSVDERFPRSCLLFIYSYQQSSYGEFKTNWYKLFLMKSPRQWYRLTASIKIHRSSIYWAPTQLSSEDCGYSTEGPLACNASLPYTFQPRLQALLAARELKDDAHFDCLLADGYGNQKNPWELHIQAQSLSTSRSSDSVSSWGFIDDLGCPRVSESEVTQVEILEPPIHFLSCLNGRIVVETRFANAIPSCELIYNIRVLHCMRDYDLFRRLIGVVVDEEKMQLKGFLLDYPGASRGLEQMARVEGTPWHQRERWARQLVQGVHQLHSNGFVAGKLLNNRSPVLIDATQTLQFWWLKHRFQPGQSMGDWYPPEFRYVQSMSRNLREEDCPHVTSKADIFKLGSALWRLAENSSQIGTNPACIRARCGERGGVCNCPQHFETIDLPPLPESIPSYYRKIVSACRAEDPNDRPAARVLLNMFPPFREHTTTYLRSAEHCNMDLNVAESSLWGPGCCDLCSSRPLPLPFFTCNVCNGGDYDICQGCHQKGFHCKDSTHLLVELNRLGNMVVPGRYYSSINSSGNRDVIEL